MSADAETLVDEGAKGQSVSGNASGSALASAETLLAPETPPPPVDAEEDNLYLSRGPRYGEGGLLGEGGMGEVRLVRDHRLGREVALKVLRASTKGATAALGRRRFLREARVQGQLEHPSVVPVYDLELDESGEARLYMKRVRGFTLEAVLRALAAGDTAACARFPRRRLLTAFVAVCRAVDYAHARGVLHRDIKPANIMLGEFGEVHLLDWGIARVRGSADILPLAPSSFASPSGPGPEPERVRGGAPLYGTADGTLLGTPGYMAPEQVRGEVSRQGPATDVFALGAVLFEILACKPLIEGSTVEKKLLATLSPELIRSPARAAPAAEVAPELDAACLQATAPEPEDRLPGAGALAEAVDRFLDGDRDLALRRSLSAELVQSAEAALSKAAQGTSADETAHAVRLLARAVALDPHQPRASELLGRLLMESPKELPREAASELAEARAQAGRLAARAGLVRAAGAIVLTVMGLAMGVRMPWLGAAGISGLLVAALFTVLWLRARSDGQRSLFRVATTIASVGGLTVVSYWAGPAILVPAIAMINGLLLLGQSDFRASPLLVGACVVPVVWAFAWSLLSGAPPPYEVAMDHILIPARLVSFPRGLTLFVLFVISAAQVVFPLVLVATLRGRLRALEERLFLHSFHLRQIALAGSEPKLRA